MPRPGGEGANDGPLRSSSPPPSWPCKGENDSSPAVSERATTSPCSHRLLALFITGPVLVGLGQVVATANPSGLSVGALAPASSPRPGEQVTPSWPGDVKEGRDYSFEAKVHGEPIHWPCTRSIPVAIEGWAPVGAPVALDLVVTRLRDASGLPLAVAAPSQIPANGEGAIRVRYVEEGNQVFGMEVSGDVVGKGGPVYDSHGVILAGRVIVREDMDPKTTDGQQVLMHEIAHALGLGHAKERLPEVMTPASGIDAWPILGLGDRFALQSVGC